jgi:hypothetical protein
MSGVYLNIQPDKIRNTVWLLRHIKAFIDSSYMEMQDPVRGFGFALTKMEARKLLIWLINIAINRKAGIQDCPSRKHSARYQTSMLRDKNRLEDIANRIRVYQFETPEISKRFGHLLSSFDDD